MVTFGAKGKAVGSQVAAPRSHHFWCLNLVSASLPPRLAVCPKYTPRGEGSNRLPIPEALMALGRLESSPVALGNPISGCPPLPRHGGSLAGVWCGVLVQGSGPGLPLVILSLTAAASPGISVPPPQFVLSWIWGDIGVQMLECLWGMAEGEQPEHRGA